MTPPIEPQLQSCVKSLKTETLFKVAQYINSGQINRKSVDSLPPELRDPLKKILSLEETAAKVALENMGFNFGALKILAKKALCALQNSKNMNDLLIEAAAGRDYELIEILLDAGANLNFKKTISKQSASRWE